MKYSEGYVAIIKNSGLMCKKKADIPEIWPRLRMLLSPNEELPNNFSKLMCVEDDLKDPKKIAVSMIQSRTTVSSRRADRLIEKKIEPELNSKLIWHDKNKHELKSNQPLDDKITSALIEKLGIAESWCITVDEYNTFAKSPDTASPPSLLLDAALSVDPRTTYEKILSK